MKSDLVYLRHIMDSILKIESYAAVGKDEFMMSPFINFDTIEMTISNPSPSKKQKLLGVTGQICIKFEMVIFSIHSPGII